MKRKISSIVILLLLYGCKAQSDSTKHACGKAIMDMDCGKIRECYYDCMQNSWNRAISDKCETIYRPFIDQCGSK